MISDQKRDWGRNYSRLLLNVRHLHLRVRNSPDWCNVQPRPPVSSVATLSLLSHAQNGRWLTPSAVGRRHANTLERNGRCIPGPSVPVRTDMYTGEAHGHACVLTCAVCMHENTRMQIKKTPERHRERKRGGEIRGRTPAAPTPIDSKEPWTPFFNKPTLHVPGTPSQQILSAAYPKQHESRRILISTARDGSG